MNIIENNENENKENENLLKQNFYLKKQYSRWILISILTIIEALNVVGSDYPAPLQSYLLGADQNLSSFEYNSLMSISYLGTAITCFSCGYLTNIYGPHRVMYLITGSHTAGLFLFTLGHYFKLLPIMIVGRFLNGIGEGNFVCYTLLVETWFKNLEISVSFSILLNGGRLLAYGLTYSLSIIRLESGSLVITLSAALAMAIFSLMLTVALNFLSDYYVKANSYTESQVEEHIIMESSFSNYAKKQLGYYRLINADSYIISIAMALCMMTLLIFSMNYNDIYTRVFGLKPEDSAFLFFLSVIGGLPFGFLCSLFFDKLGFRLYFLLLGCLSVIAIHIMIAYLDPMANVSYVIWLIFPIAFTSWSSAFWPILISLNPKYLISTAPAIYYLVNFGSNTLVSLIYGVIKDKTNYLRQGYFWASHFMLLFTVPSLILLIISVVRNIRKNLNLNHPKFGKY